MTRSPIVLAARYRRIVLRKARPLFISRLTGCPSIEPSYVIPF